MKCKSIFSNSYSKNNIKVVVIFSHCRRLGMFDQYSRGICVLKVRCPTVRNATAPRQVLFDYRKFSVWASSSVCYSFSFKVVILFGLCFIFIAFFMHSLSMILFLTNFAPDLMFYS